MSDILGLFTSVCRVCHCLSRLLLQSITSMAAVAMDGKVNDGAPPSAVAADQFSAGLLAALTPAVESCDANIRRVLESQDALGGHIERLTAALNAFTTGAMMPPALAPYTGKLSGARRKLKKINQSVVRINQRLEEIRTMVRKKEMANRARAGPTAAVAAAPAKTAVIHSTGIAQALASAGSTTLPSSLIGAPSIAIATPPSTTAAAATTPTPAIATTPATAAATPSSNTPPSTSESKETAVAPTEPAAAVVNSGGSATVTGPLPTDTPQPSGAPSGNTPSLSARSGTSNVNSLMDLLDWD